MNQNIEILTWKEVREDVQKVNPDLTTVLDCIFLPHSITDSCHTRSPITATPDH